MSKKIFLIRNVALGEYGGGETYQVKLGLMLKKYGFEPVILTSSNGLLKAAKENKIETVAVPYINRQNWSGWRNILFPIYFVKIMKLKKWYKKVFEEYRPSVINVQSRDDWIASTGVAKKMGIKVLWTDHMDFRSWVLVNVDVWCKNWIGKWILRCAKKVDKIIMISDFERKSFEKMVKPRKYDNLETIKNGVEDEYENYKNVKCKKNSICYVGRIVEYKGIGELVNAFRIVAKEVPDMVLNIYGSGEDLERYKELTKDDKGIHFHGQTAEPLRVLAENEIFVLPSYKEGLSLSLLDAAMMGKEIIVSNVDGNPEIVLNEKTGLLVPPKDVKKMVEAMMYILGHKQEAIEMAKNVREYYKKNFDFDKIFAEKMLPLYNNEKEEE